MGEAVNLLGDVFDVSDGARVAPSGVRAVAVHFLSYGRNAWHSTWIRRYSVGDFAREGRAVQRKVDERRGPGTVFYLTVLPAIQVDFGSRKFVVTEINTNEPFRHIDLDQARYPLLANNMRGFLDYIEPTSTLWKSGQKRENSVILQEVDEDYIDFAAYSALAKGRDKANNPPVGNYKRAVWGQDWHWADNHERISLRWYNRALEALMESRERLADHFG